MAKLLVVDDEKNLRLVIQRELTRQGHEAEEPEDDQRADGEPDALLELGRLRKVGEAHVAGDIVGA